MGITDLEARYNVTDDFQISLGGDNLFNIRPDTVPFDQTAYGTTPGSGGPADGGNVIGNPIPGAFDPNGGYYYGRVSFNF